MPKLVLFVACEKAIYDQEKSLSLIGIVQELTVQVPEMGHLPSPGTSAAFKWDIVSIWASQPDDVGKRFEQRVALLDPQGKQTDVSATLGIEVTGPYHRNLTKVFGFPISSAGRHTLKLWLSENGTEAAEPIAEYHIDVVYDPLKK